MVLRHSSLRRALSAVYICLFLLWTCLIPAFADELDPVRRDALIRASLEGAPEPYRAVVEPYLSGDARQPKILNGIPASVGQFPWQVSLMDAVHIKQKDRYKAHFCGGSIIAPQWILTAAHCVYGLRPLRPDELVVGSGIVNLRDQLLKVSAVQRIYVKDGYVSPRNGNDIALIKLMSPLSFTSNTNLVRIASPHNESRLVKSPDGFVVSGFGVSANTGDTSTLLHYSKPRYIDRDTCDELEAYDGQVSAEMLCAGWPLGGQDFCYRDSGGALQKEGYQVGIVSWSDRCGQPNKYGVYSRVSTYVDWIEECMKKPQMCRRK